MKMGMSIRLVKTIMERRKMRAKSAKKSSSMILSPHLERLCDANTQGHHIANAGLRGLINVLEAMQHKGFDFSMIETLKTVKND
jgi:hypothetical protein